MIPISNAICSQMASRCWASNTALRLNSGEYFLRLVLDTPFRHSMPLYGCVRKIWVEHENAYLIFVLLMRRGLGILPMQKVCLSEFILTPFMAMVDEHIQQHYLKAFPPVSEDCEWLIEATKINAEGGLLASGIKQISPRTQTKRFKCCQLR